MQVTCSCGKVLNVPDKLAGKTARCPTCKKILQMPGAAPEGPAASRIMIECSCGKKLAAPAAAAGKKVACPKCNKELTVPGAAKKPSAPVITPMPGPASYASAPTRPAKLPPAGTDDLSFDVEAPPPEAPKPTPAAMDTQRNSAAHEEYGLGSHKCPNCKAELPNSAQFCVECGTALATGTKMQAAAPGVVKKWSLKDFKFSDIDPDLWRKIFYGAILAVLVALGYWYMYWPHGMTPEQMRRAAQASGESPRPPGMPPIGGGRGGRGNIGD